MSRGDFIFGAFFGGVIIILTIAFFSINFWIGFGYITLGSLMTVGMVFGEQIKEWLSQPLFKRHDR